MKNYSWILICLMSLSAFGRKATISTPEKKLQELIKLSQSGDYKPAFQKDDLFCGGKNVNTGSRISSSDKAKLCKITTAEYEALHGYTVEENFALNAVLRKTAPATQEINTKISNLKKALKKLDSVSALTLRETDLPHEEEKNHIVGTIVKYPGFTSTSLSLNYERNMSHTFFMYVKNCKYISALSTITSEHEVLCEPGAKFKVQAYSKVGEHHYYLMDQVN